MAGTADESRLEIATVAARIALKIFGKNCSPFAVDELALDIYETVWRNEQKGKYTRGGTASEKTYCVAVARRKLLEASKKRQATSPLPNNLPEGEQAVVSALDELLYAVCGDMQEAINGQKAIDNNAATNRELADTVKNRKARLQGFICAPASS